MTIRSTSGAEVRSCWPLLMSDKCDFLCGYGNQYNTNRARSEYARPAAAARQNARSERLTEPESVNRLGSTVMAEYAHRESCAAPAAPVSRRDRKKQRTRSGIYHSAMTLFLQRGFDSVTIDEICDAADVARATFFLHFPAKEALLAEYGARANEELADLIRNHGASATSTLRAALKTLAERAARHPDLVRMVVSEVLSRPPLLIGENHEHTRDLVSLIAAVIRRGQAAGEFRRKAEPHVAAVALCSAFFAFVHEWTPRGGRLDVEAVIGHTLDVVLNGLSERRRRAR